MARKTWDVEDDRRLRSALGSTTEFANDAYHRLWAAPEMGMTSGAVSSLWHMRAYTLADAATQYARFAFLLPDNWKRGVIDYRWHIGAITNTGANVVNVRHRSRRYEFEPGSSMAVSDLLDVTEDYTFEDGGASAVREQYHPTGWDTRIDLDTYHAISCELTRNGAAGSDSVTNTLYVVGLELVFNPDARP